MSNNTYLLVGTSGAGKTILAKKLCLKSGHKHHYVVNNNNYDDQYLDQFKSVTFEETLTLSNCSIIFEDLLLLSAQEIKTLVTMINRQSRHRNITVIMLVHSLLANNCFHLVRIVRHLIFFAQCSVANLKAVLVHLGMHDKQEINILIQEFTKYKNKLYSFFHLNTNTGAFGPSSIEKLVSIIQAQNKNSELHLVEMDNNKEQLLKRGCQILELSPNSKESCLLFQLIAAKFHQSLDLNDYTLKLYNKEVQTKEKYNILDLCALAVNNSSQNKPDQRTYLLFNFVMQHLHPPKCLIRNPHLKRLMPK